MMPIERRDGIPPLAGFLFSFEIYAAGRALCSAAFSEVAGLEATVEPKTIREGGRTWGAEQRAGNVSFATVVLKRGITASRDAWNWFDLIHRQGALSQRYTAYLAMAQPGEDGGGEALVWRFSRVLPVKCKVGDLNAATTAIAIEELHLVHEGMTLEPRA